MGFQSYHNTDAKEHNMESNKVSAQRTSNVERLSKDTTHAQYERHGRTAAVDTRGKITENYEGHASYPLNRKEAEAAVGRTSGIKTILKGQGHGFPVERLSKTGKKEGTI